MTAPTPNHAYTYNPTPTLHAAQEFFVDNWINKRLPTMVGVLGPPGSGKTVNAIQMLDLVYLRANPAPNGDRYVRIGIVRKTIKELRTTVLQSIKQWFPVSFGTITGDTGSGNKPFHGEFHIPNILDGGKTTCHVELVGVAYDAESDFEGAMDALRSYEFTAIYVNEISSLHPSILTMGFERTGRYPSNALGDPMPRLLIVDYNMPYINSWATDLDAPEKNGEFRDSNGKIQFVRKVFVQPPSAIRTELREDPSNPEKVTDYIYEVNPNAEIPAGFTTDTYSAQLLLAKQEGDYDKLDREHCMLKVPDQSRKPVYGRSFSRERHLLDHEFIPTPNNFTVVGVDTSGLHPAASFVQEIIGVGWVLTMSLYGENLSIYEFIDAITALTTELPKAKGGQGFFDKHNMLVVCDPADTRNQGTLLTPTEIFRQKGFKAIRAETNAIAPRNTALKKLLEATAAPYRFYIAPICKMVVEGLESKHVYKRIANTTEYNIIPDKNTVYSHYIDSLEYAAMHIHAQERVTNVLSNVPALPSEKVRYI